MPGGPHVHHGRQWMSPQTAGLSTGRVGRVRQHDIVVNGMLDEDVVEGDGF